MNPHAPTLIHWGARSIPVAQHHYHALHGRIQVLEIRGHTENELATILPEWLADLHPDTPVTIAPDDLVVSHESIRIVHDACTSDPTTAHCGWSNTDFTSGLTNVQHHAPHKPEPGSAGDYTLLTVQDVAKRAEPFPVGFNGFSLLTMPAHRWIHQDTRIESCQPGSGQGFASDWRTCLRLDAAGVPIVCHSEAFVAHLKMDYTRIDHNTAWKRLNLRDKHVRWIPTTGG